MAWHVDANGVVTGPVVLPSPTGHLIRSPTQMTETNNGVTTIVGFVNASVKVQRVPG